MTRKDSAALFRAAGLGEVFTWRQALAAGFGPSDLRVKAVKQVLHGVYTTVDDPDQDMVRAQGALLRAGDGAVICGATALRLLGVGLPTGIAHDTRLDVHLPLDRPRPRAAGMRVWRGELAGQAVEHQGLPLAHPGDCWAQLAPHLSVDDLVIIADGLTRRRNPITRLKTLGSMLRDSTPGVVRARQALELARECTDSPPETVMRLMLVHAGLPCPEVNYKVTLSDGTFHLLDTAYTESKVAPEYNGAVHVNNHDKMQADELRRRVLEDMGWRLITLTWDDLTTRPASAVRSVRDALRKARR